MDIYVLYGHSDDTICVQKNNTNNFIEQNLVELTGSFTVDLKNGESIEKSWEINVSKAKGWWEMSSTFISDDNVQEIIRLNQKTVGSNRSDDTVKYEVSNGRTLEFTTR